MGIRCTDHVTLYPQKLALTSPTSGGRIVGIIHLRTTSHGVFFLLNKIFLVFVREISTRATLGSSAGHGLQTTQLYTLLKRLE